MKNAGMLIFGDEMEVKGTLEHQPLPSRPVPGVLDERKKTVLRALWRRPQMREEIDQLADTTNGPQMISILRAIGLEVPCKRVPVLARDGPTIYRGLYSLTERDRLILRAWHDRPARTVWPVGPKA